MSRVAGPVGDCAGIIYLVPRLHVYPNQEYLEIFSFLRPSSFLGFASSPGRVTAGSNNQPSTGSRERCSASNLGRAANRCFIGPRTADGKIQFGNTLSHSISS